MYGGVRPYQLVQGVAECDDQRRQRGLGRLG